MDALDDPTTFSSQLHTGSSQLHTGSPVRQIGDSPFYAVGSWDLIAEAVRRPEDFSSNLTATMVWHEDGSVSEFPVAGLGNAMHVLATADGSRHRDHRTLVMPSVAPARIRALEPHIRHLISDAWDAGLNDDRIDWISAVAQRVPMSVVVELIGLPVADVEILTRWAVETNALIDGIITPEQLTTATAAVGEVTDYLSRALTRQTDTGAGSRTGRTVLADVARGVADGHLDHSSAVMILFQLVAAGAESTVSLLGSAVWLLGRNPGVVEQLRRDRTLIPVFIEETLRLETPFLGHFRHVVSDTTLGDTHLPAGSHVFLLWGAANRDPAHFDDPARIDLAPTTRRPHLGFGKGLHLCVGAALARLQARLAVEHLIGATTDFRVQVSEAQRDDGLLVRKLTALPVSVSVPN